jgi:hypothetical protein
VVPVFEDYQLRIVQPRTFYAGRSQARRMVYGRNLKSLSFKRRMGGQKVPTIEVRCYDPSLGRTRWARHPVAEGQAASGVFGESDPPRPTRANHIAPSGAQPEDRIEATAESIWQQIGRQEIEGSFSTDDVDSFESEIAADLLALRTGDAVELLVASASDLRESTASATELEGLSLEARARYLQSVGWSEGVARRFAQLQEAVSFQTTFRVQSAQFSFDQDDGISITVDFINFLTVRENRQPEEATTSPEVEALTAGRDDPAAEDARASSLERRRLTQQRESGEITEDEYQASVERVAADERRQVRLVRGG